MKRETQLSDDGLRANIVRATLTDVACLYRADRPNRGHAPRIKRPRAEVEARARASFV